MGATADTGTASFDDLLRRAAWRAPDDPFVWWSDRDRTITYAEADALADLRVGYALSGWGQATGLDCWLTTASTTWLPC